MNESKIRIALADDQRLLREGLRIILEAAPDMLVVGEAEDGIAATALAATEQPDVMLMDIRMPRRDGIAATEIIHKTHPSVRIILLTTYDTPELVVEGLRAGRSSSRPPAQPNCWQDSLPLRCHHLPNLNQQQKSWG
jgi:DNA-binding NarL/FixJ family response regulator